MMHAAARDPQKGGSPDAARPPFMALSRREFYTTWTREARRWSIVNLSILVSYKCKALMNVCAMVRSVCL